jgi:hypothetical protein
MAEGPSLIHQRRWSRYFGAARHRQRAVIPTYRRLIGYWITFPTAVKSPFLYSNVWGEHLQSKLIRQAVLSLISAGWASDACNSSSTRVASTPCVSDFYRRFPVAGFKLW